VIAVTTLLLVVVISLLITRVATVIFAATGMSRETARFQARSAFSGTGFTTKEAEDVLNHPVRRKVVMWLMLLGNAGIVAAASSTILGFRGGGVGRQYWRILELVVGGFVLIYVSRSRWVDRWLTRVISRYLSEHTDLPTRDLAGLLDLAGDYSVSELAIDPEDWVGGHTLGELALRDEGIVVLGVTRSDGSYLAVPTGRTAVNPGDVLVLYGHEDNLCELDDRPAGESGDLRHQAAVARQAELERQEQEPADAAP
jgi:hypothetical protein